MEHLPLRLYIVILICSSAAGAASLDEAARELARRLQARIGAQGRIAAISSRALPAPGPSDRDAAERILRRELGARISPEGDDLRLTVSHASRRGLLIAELRRGGEVFVAMEEYDTGPRNAMQPSREVPSPRLEKRLIWEQDVPMLDAVFAADRLLVLDVHGVSMMSGGRVSERFSFPPSASAVPRDVRGRIAAGEDGAFRAWLPGMACRGAVSPQLRAECSFADGGAPWPVAPGLEAEMNGLSNHFEHPRMQPFFTAARIAEGPLVAAGVDGKTRFIDASGVRESDVAAGSDIAALGNPCEGGGSLLVSSADSGLRLSAYTYEGRKLRERPERLEAGGAIMALWPGGEDATATMIARSPGGRYAAYRVSAVCGR